MIKKMTILCCLGMMMLTAQAQENPLTIEISRFLTIAASTRITTMETAKLAAERGSTPEIREFGKLLIKDQSLLLEQLKKAAKAKNIALPNNIASEKRNEVNTLKKQKGKEFDEMFLHMTATDYKHEVREFRIATECVDKTTRDFAVQNLPVIKRHLKGAEKMQKKIVAMQ